MTSNNIQVCIKVRPLIQREKNDNLQSVWSVIDENTIKSINKEYKYSFDHIFDETKTTQELFDGVAKPIVLNAMKGINGTIFAYGQTSSGKTFCMMGTEQEQGIIPLTIKEIFDQIEMTEDREFLLRVGYIEIYNERIFDLLDEDKIEISKIHENQQGEVSVNQTEVVTSSQETILNHYNKGSRGRIVGETGMNERSSRSHTIFRIIIESKSIKEDASHDGVVQVSTLNLVDLAGSERADLTRATGERLREGGHINKSLLSLSNVIRDLSNFSDNPEKGEKYINYRDSKLTRILSASLGGNAMTAIICTITPAALDETYSTLTFAGNAKKIKNKPKVNEIVSDKVIMNRLQKEIASLRDQLKLEKSRNSERGLTLQEQIREREDQFIQSHNITVGKLRDANRRRTWCPSSKLEEGLPKLKMPPPNHAAPPPFIFKDASVSPSELDKIYNKGVSSDEEFKPSSDIDFDNPLSPAKGRTTDELINLIHTPRSFRSRVEPESPEFLHPRDIMKPKDPYETIKLLEEELEELRDFKIVEEATAFKNSDVEKLKQDLAIANEQLDNKDGEILDLQNILLEKNDEINKCKALEQKLRAVEVEKSQAIKEKETAVNMLASLEYEYELAKSKAKKREDELIQSLNEARDESKLKDVLDKNKRLEEQLKKLEEESYRKQQSGNDDLSGKISELEKQLKAVKDELASVTKDYEETSAQLLDASEENESLQKKINELQMSVEQKHSDYENALSKLSESEIVVSKFKKIQEVLKNQESLVEQDLPEDDDFGKIILKLHTNASKTASLEVEKLQLLQEIDDIRQVAFELSEKLANQTVLESGNDIEELNRQLCDAKTEKTNTELMLAELRNKFAENENSLNAEIARLRSEIEEKEADDNLRQLLEESNSKVRQYECEIERLTQLASQMEESQQAVKTELQSMRAELNQLPKCNDTIDGFSDDKIKELTENLATTNNLNIEYEEKIKVLEGCIVELNGTISKLQEGPLVQHDSEIQQFMSEVKEKDEELMRLSEILAEARVESKNHEDKVIDLEGNAIIMGESIIELEKNAASLQEKIENYEKLMQEKSDNIVVLSEKIKELECATDNSDKYTQLEENYQNLLNTYNDKLSELRVVSESLEAATKSNEINLQKIVEAESTKAMVEDLRREISSKSEVIERLQAENANLLQENGVLKNEIDEALNELAENSGIIESLEQKNQSLHNRILNLMSPIVEESERLKEGEEKYFKLTDEYQSKQEELKKVRELLTASQGLNEINQQKLDEQTKLVDDLKTSLNDKSKECDQLNEKIKNIETTLSEKDTKIKDFKLQVLRLDHDKESLSKMLKECEGLEKENEELVLKTATKDIHIEELSHKLEEINANYVACVEQNNDLQSKLTKTDAETTNRDSIIIMKDEEIKSLTQKLDTLKNQLKERQAECDEVKTRYRRRSQDSVMKIEQLENKNAELLQNVGAVELFKSQLESEVKKLQAVNAQLSTENKTLQDQCNDNDMKYSILDEKYSQLAEVHKKCEKEFSDLNVQLEKCMEENEVMKKDIEALNRDVTRYMSDNFSQSKTIAELREKCDELVKKPSSPQNRRSGEKEHEDETLLTKRKMLIMENHGTPVRAVKSLNDRKTRRQSVHDEYRRLSTWESHGSVETQTDPSDEKCACNELNEKIKKLQIDIRIRDCKIANNERMASINLWKLDIDELKKSLQKEQRDHSQTKTLLEAANSKIKALKHKNEELALNQRVIVESAEQSNQTDGSFIEKCVFDQLEQEKKIIEKELLETQQLMRQKEDITVELERKISEKENYSNNSMKPQENNTQSIIIKAENDTENSIKISYEGLKKDHSALMHKYDTARRLCNLRNDDLNKLRDELSQVTSELGNIKADHELLTVKYTKMKTLCEIRMEKIKGLRAELEKFTGENIKAEPTETVTINSLPNGIKPES